MWLVLLLPGMKPQITSNCHKRNLLSRWKNYSKATFSLLTVRNLLISMFPILAAVKRAKKEAVKLTKVH
jgi:hypothetical protein